MKKAKVLLTIGFCLFAIAIGMGFYLHKLALEQVLYMERQQQGTLDRVVTFDKKLSDYQNVLDNFDSQFKKYAETLQNLETALGPSETGRKDLVVVIDTMKKEIEDLKTGYASTISQLQSRVSELEGKLAAQKTAADTKVQLGEVAIEKKK